MARYTFNLSLGALGVTLKPDVEGWQRSIVANSQVILQDFTPNGAPLYSGPAAFTRRYSWAYSGVVTEQECLIVEAIARAQTPTLLPTLTDEFYYLEPVATAPDKPILAGSLLEVQTGFFTGFFEGDVWLSLEGDYKKLVGGTDCLSDPTKTYYELTFTLLEVP